MNGLIQMPPIKVLDDLLLAARYDKLICGGKSRNPVGTGRFFWHKDLSESYFLRQFSCDLVMDVTLNICSTKWLLSGTMLTAITGCLCISFAAQDATDLAEWHSMLREHSLNVQNVERRLKLYSERSGNIRIQTFAGAGAALLSLLQIFACTCSHAQYSTNVYLQTFVACIIGRNIDTSRSFKSCLTSLLSTFAFFIIGHTLHLIFQLVT